MFQRLMDRLLQGSDDFAVAYIWMILLSLVMSGRTTLKHLQDVLTRLENAGLIVKLSKSKFAKQSCEYLGHTIGNGVVKPIFSKIEAVRSFPSPDTKSAVQTLLGITGYYRRFIPDFRSVTAPLTDVTKTSAPNYVLWNEECERAFEILKKAFCTDPVLISPDLTKMFVLQTDASDRGIGAVLSQLGADGQEHL